MLPARDLCRNQKFALIVSTIGPHKKATCYYCGDYFFCICIELVSEFLVLFVTAGIRAF